MRRGFLYVGTHRRAYRADPVDTAFGIYGFCGLEDGGPLMPAGMTPSSYPGWIALHPNRRFLYAANEDNSFEGTAGGGLTAFAIEAATGALTPLNTRCTPSLPCHCQIDATGRFLVVATYGGGTVHLFTLLPDGRLGPEVDAHQHVGCSLHPQRQSQPHPHSVNFDPGNRFIFVPDLGTDQIVVYELVPETAKLVPHPELTVHVAPGSGPRHLAFDPHEHFAYLINELSVTITAFAYNATVGALQEMQTLDALPEGFAGYRSGAEIAIHPSGRFIYVTTRSHGSKGEPPVRGLDSIAWCAINPKDGTLAMPSRIHSGGGIPRSFTFDSGGDHLIVAHQGSGTIVTFRIIPDTGVPIPTGEVVSTPVPVCVCLYDPS